MGAHRVLQMLRALRIMVSLGTGENLEASQGEKPASFEPSGYMDMDKSCSSFTRFLTFWTSHRQGFFLWDGESGCIRDKRLKLLPLSHKPAISLGQFRGVDKTMFFWM